MSRLQEARLVFFYSSGYGVCDLDSIFPFEEHDISISLHTPLVTKLLVNFTLLLPKLIDINLVNAKSFNVFCPGSSR